MNAHHEYLDYNLENIESCLHLFHALDASFLNNSTSMETAGY